MHLSIGWMKKLYDYDRMNCYQSVIQKDIRFFLHPYEDKASITIRLLTIWVEWCQNICSAASLQEMVHFVKENSFCIWNFFQLNSLLFITCSFGGGVST